VAAALGISSGSAAEVAARLRELRLLAEAPAPAAGRGRPTSLLRPHPDGPLVLALELRHDDWRSALAGVDGVLHPFGHGNHAGPDPTPVLATLTGHVARAHAQLRRRLRAVSLAVAAGVEDGRLVDVSSLGWAPVALNGLVGQTGLPLLVGNDATLAGVAEARTGAAAGSPVALHVLLEAGLGGALVLDGRPVLGAHGSAGEFGHLPFGDRARRCHCGARGCWQLQVGGAALARELGEAAPRRPRDYTVAVLARAGRDPAAARAVEGSAAALGAGIAGLVNSHDPAVVTIGGLAGPLRAAAPAAFETAYLDGLMAFRRARPARVLDAGHGQHGVLAGTAAVGLDLITGEAALADWAASLT
jgi:predicted NBD/HSP70 family sugar kinase